MIRTPALSALFALLLSLLASSTPPAVAQDADPFLDQYARTYRFRLGQPTRISPTPDGAQVLFLRSGPRSFVHDLFALDAATGEERVLLTAESVLRGEEEHLTPEEKARRERMRMAGRGIATYSLSQDGAQVLLPLSGRLFIVDRATGASRELVSDAGYPIDPQLAPDGARLACVRDGDLFLTTLADGREIRLTTREGPHITNGLAEFIAQEEMGRFHGFWWSPDSRAIAWQRTDTTGLEVFNIADPGRPERAVESWPYPRAGTKNADVRLAVTHLGDDGAPSRTLWIDWDHDAFPYLAGVWWPKNAPLTILIQNRAQTLQRLLAVDHETGSTTLLLEETDDAWINLEDSNPKWLDSGEGFLWMTERGGAWQLEHRARDGRLVATLTPIDFGLRTVLDVDGDEATVVASDDPAQAHLWRVPLNPARAPYRLTDEPGRHSAVFSKDHSTLVESASLLGGEIRWRISRFERDGARARLTPLRELRSVAETPAIRINLELTTVGEAPPFHVALVRPRDFEPGRRYPVIASVYAGPTATTVTAAGRAYLLDQWMADQGYIVVRMDGRGTPGRGRAWERSISGNLIDIALEDHAAILALLGERFPELDMARVGVTGWSFGGYFAAMAAMRRPDVYACGVAGAPVTDWADYDTHYTERYMRTPRENPEGYRAANVMTYAADLERPLLLIHGTSDDNVYFMHSLKLSEALFRAGKRFEFLPLSGFTHMVPDPVVTIRLQQRIMDFLSRALADQGAK